MKMEKRTFRIGELTQVLSKNGPEIEPSVIRFWEKEFDISPKRSNKGQRYYDERDLSKFIKIRELLYEKRFTIEGARQALGTPSRLPTKIQNPTTQGPNPFLAELGQLRSQLQKLKNLL